MEPSRTDVRKLTEMLYFVLIGGIGISGIMLILAIWRGVVDSPMAGLKMAGLAVLVTLASVFVFLKMLERYL
jgi:hypothetical protein